MPAGLSSLSQQPPHFWESGMEFGKEAPVNKMGDSRHFLYREQDSSVKFCCAELSNDAQVTPGGAFVCVL